MRPEARAIGNALLEHHRRVTKKTPPGKKVFPANYTIRYGVLCEQAGVSHVVRIVGSFLGEVAEWCSSAGYPPLNSLAVNESRQPGEGYDGAGGFKIVNWPTEVEQCIRFKTYPVKIP